MLANSEDAWRVPELHPLRAKYPWIGTKKLLQLHFHVIGNDANLEGILFLEYIAHVREHFPDAPIPGLFADERLFDDAELKLRRPPVPPWWYADVREQPEEPADLPAPVTRRKPKVVDERQLGLPTIPVAAPVVATPTPAPARASSVFGSSDILAARAPDTAEREQVANAVELLLARGGMMSADAFAAAMGVMGFRVGGYVSRFSEILNIDGYEVLRMDHGSKQIHLDREKLAQLFEVKA